MFWYFQLNPILGLFMPQKTTGLIVFLLLKKAIRVIAHGLDDKRFQKSIGLMLRAQNPCRNLPLFVLMRLMFPK